MECIKSQMGGVERIKSQMGVCTFPGPLVHGISVHFALPSLGEVSEKVEEGVVMSAVLAETSFNSVSIPSVPEHPFLHVPSTLKSPSQAVPASSEEVVLFP